MRGEHQPMQHSDQMVCLKCYQVWDMNDPDPPPCERGPVKSHGATLMAWAILLFVPLVIITWYWW